MWRVYGARAQRAKPRRLKTLTALALLRYRSRQWKRWVDPARGVLLTIWLKAYRPATATDGQKTPSAPELRRLLDWLRATGEFCEEADRLDPWVDFLARLSPTDFARHFAAISKVTTWFETNSRIALGRYTEGVEDFLRYTQSNRRWREDQVLTGRHRIEYHLNMIGAEIMNRAFAPAFHRRRRKVVLLPECMRKLRDGACQGDPTPLGIQCAGCTPQCSVHQLSCLGKARGFEVYVVEHASTVLSGVVVDTSEISVVGVACPLQLLAGGWKTKSLGVPAQCVLLDYSGCRQHWHPEGIQTTISLKELRRRLAGSATDIPLLQP